jgi:antibiotic biosynthesis monooxygenase (ABM) superfamily enzyme
MTRSSRTLTDEVGDSARTVVVTRVVRPGKDQEFAEWADAVDRAASSSPGHLGGVRLHDDQGLSHLVYQFDSPEHLRAWERSPKRRELLAAGRELSDERRSTAGGPNTWFDVPGGNAPPGWKRFLVTWGGAFPTLLVVSTLVSQIGLPQVLTLAISSCVLTAVLTWVILPRLTRRARPWLFRHAEPTPRERPS